MELSELPHGVLAVLAREYLLCGHLIDRAGMPYVIASFDREEMGAIAIDEWMGASPVYTRRMQELLGFAGDDVETIFKGMQFDIGAPHGFLDFRYTVHDRNHGGFQLDHCGALMDVEPMGEEFVRTMCHDIEDPTFDATAAATNPRARMTPLHRPPREPADRSPHCAWTVDIEAAAEPILEAGITAQVAAGVAAATPLPVITPRSSDGSAGHGGSDTEGGDTEGSVTERSALRDDYSGALVDRIATEEFSVPALVAIIEELCLQQHLLAHAFMVAVANRHGDSLARELGEHQFVGSAGMSSQRLAAALSVHCSTEAELQTPLDLLADVLSIHPALRPRSYVDVQVTSSVDHVDLSLLESPGTLDDSPFSWPALLRDGCDRAVAAMVAGVHPNLSCAAVEPPPGTVARWRVEVAAEPVTQQPEVTLAEFSTGTHFELPSPEPTAVEVRGRS